MNSRPARTRFSQSTLILALLVMTLFAGSAPLRTARASVIEQGQSLDFEARLACRTAVQQVYWQEMDWPATNPSPKPALDQALPREAIEAQVVDALAGTVALAERWDLDVTTGMLQAELDRMALNSQSPERLQRLFEALENDPSAIAECLVRPLLVDRLIRQRYGQDGEIHAGARAAAESALLGVLDADQLAALPNAETITWRIGAGEADLTGRAAADGTTNEASFQARLADARAAFQLDAEAALPVDRVSRLQEDAGRFYSIAVKQSSPTELQVVIASWPKQTFESWWDQHRGEFGVDRFVQPEGAYVLPAVSGLDAFEGGEGAWQYMPAIPWATTSSRSVWTGSVMLVWGGGYTTNGFRYDPALDDWRPITTLNAPHGRHSFTAVWSGTEMIVFGGCNGALEFCTDGGGGRYDPLTDTWADMAYGTGRKQHTAVWSGSEMLVWGGCTENSNGNQNCSNLIDQGARYNPSTDSWSPMSMNSAPAGTRYPASIWAGDQMIIWNGTGGVNGRYFPATDDWQPISTIDGPPGLYPTLVWTGEEMIAWGGCTGVGFCSTLYNEGGRYDPVANDWTPTSLAGAPSARIDHTAVWTGSEMIVWGGYDGAGTFFGDGGRYDPASNSWEGMSANGSPSERGSHHTVWTGTEMVVWGGAGPGDERAGARYSPATDSWLPTTTNDPYRNANYHASVWDGVRMISWGGEGEQFIDPFYQRARLYDPATDSWSMSSRNEDLDYFWWPSAVWTGTEMIVWGGQYGSSIFDLGSRYNPLTDSWVETSTNGAPEARGNHTAVWTGSEMIVWGGSTWTQLYVKTGGRYDPETDSWTPTPTTGAPTGRYLHQAVWTGTEMIVWGGQTGTGATNTGGKYDPLTNSWSPISMTGAPSARLLFGSVWTGSEFIVWGGGGITSGWTFPQTGGRYDPAADVWTPTSMNGAPEGRARTAAVWTGSEFIVWGGCTGSSCLVDVHTGGRYDPAADAWTATSTDHVIEGREFHTMVWTGSEMIVWGGQTDRNGYTHIGGRYAISVSDNTAPQAFADEYTTPADTTLDVAAPGVLGNDLDPDGDPLTAVLVTGPLSGVLDFETDGSFSYQPAAGFSGTVFFQYKASDGQAVSNTTVVAINVTSEPNQPPVGSGDSYLALVDTPLIVEAPGVLGNDSDPDGDPLTAVTETATAHGQLSLASDGSFTYTPDQGFTGMDSFTYRAFDGQVYSDPVTVTIEVEETPPTGDFQIFLPVLIRP